MALNDPSKWDQYCRVIYHSYSVGCPDFFKQDALSDSIDDDINLYNLLSTSSVDSYIYENQDIRMLFTIAGYGDYYHIYTAESFSGAGDFVHYKTDLILAKSLLTNECYIASDRYYKLNLKPDFDKGKILNALSKFTKEHKNQAYGFCDDVMLFLDRNDAASGVIDFVILSATEDTTGYAEYNFCFYWASYDLNADKISGVEPVNLCSFKDIINGTLAMP